MYGSYANLLRFACILRGKLVKFNIIGVHRRACSTGRSAPYMVTMMTRQMNNASLRHLSDGVFVLCDICRHGRQTYKRCGKVSAEAKDRKR